MRHPKGNVEKRKAICFAVNCRSGIIPLCTVPNVAELDQMRCAGRAGHRPNCNARLKVQTETPLISIGMCATKNMRSSNMKIVMVLTSHDQLGNTGLKTGIWLEEFAAPYFVFRDAGIELTLASPKGGQPPIDPKSDAPENQTPAMARFKQDAAAQKAFSQTAKLADMKAEDFDTVFYPGGHGPMWDLAESTDSIALLESFYNSDKPIALVCHSPGVLRHVTYNGAPLVKGKHVTGFTNGEEEAMQLTKVVPFLVEDELLRLGAIFEKMANWQPFSIVDGRLITGQNPASSTVTAQALMKVLGERAAHASA
jgi:putative intracellular protease/amidase